LLAAGIALPSLLLCQPIVIALILSSVALRANWTAILPAQHSYRVDAVLRIRVVADGFGQCVRDEHEAILCLSGHVVKEKRKYPNFFSFYTCEFP
jgi:hypothetical protein